MTAPLSIGMIGSGLIAQLQAGALLRVPHVRIDALLARSGAQAFADVVRGRGQGLAVVYQSVADICQHVDAVAVLAPPFAQLELVKNIVAAKAAGAKVRAIMIDKPLGRNVEEAEAICALIKGAGLLSAYFENQIHMPAVRKLRHHLAALQNQQGSPLLVRSAEEHAGPHSAWFWNPALAGGGVLLDMGCHSIAVGWYLLTPVGKALDFLKPVSVQCSNLHLKWNQPRWRADLKQRLGVPLEQPIGEDHTTGVIEFLNPESKRRVCLQFSNSWMYDRPGLKLSIETLGAGYTFDIDTQRTPLQAFVSGSQTCSIISDEGDTYGYVDEFRDAYINFATGSDALMNVNYGAAITKLMMACYLSAQSQRRIDLTDPAIAAQLLTYRPVPTTAGYKSGQGT